ncbi:MAG: hypothetical protein U0935_02625 [Pirellulales bacterium]
MQRRDVHAERGTGIHFQDGSALLLQRHADILSDDVETGDVESHGARGQHGFVGVGRMHFGRTVGRQIAHGLDHYPLAGFRDRGGVESLLFQFDQRGIIELEDGELVGVVLTPSRITIDFVDQFADGPLAVPHHEFALTAGRCHQAMSDHQQAVRLSQSVLLDQHPRVVAIFDRPLVGGHDLFTGRQVERDASGVVGATRLDDDRKANFLSGHPGVVGAGDRSSLRHGHSDGAQQAFRQFLVLSDALGNGARGVCFRRPDASLMAAFAELHQASRIETSDRNPARRCRADDGPAARSESHVVGQIDELADE